MISDVEDALEIELTDADSDTFSGFVMGLYGSIPEDGSTFELSTETLDIQILDVQEHKVECAIVTRKLTTPAEDEDEKEKDKDKTSKSETVSP
jgi:putative hemolysin